MSVTTTAQLNVRLDAKTRDRGNKTLNEAGYTPLQFIRKIWEGLAKPESNAKTVEKMLSSVNIIDNADSVNKKKELLRIAQEGSAYLENIFATAGIALSELPDDSEWENLKAESRLEKFGACM